MTTTSELDRSAIVLAPPEGDRRIVTGLTLGERGRRVAKRAGVVDARLAVVRTAAELTAARKTLTGPLLVLDARDQVVAAELMAAVELERPGARYAIDPERGDADAGALVVDAADASAVLDALAADFTGGVVAARAAVSSATAIPAPRRARFPVPDRAAVRAADKWQYELVDKPLDSWLCRYFYRPLARPLTKLFLRSPLSPNAISIVSIILSLVGCAIAAGPTRLDHIIGLAILVVGGIVDANDGEVARLRLEMSKTGAWLDAIGDDMARLALVACIGVHVSHLHPDWPALAITGAALAMTVMSLVLIYWYCIFVINSSNNQDYTKALQIGPGVRADGPRGLGAAIADFAAQIIRRDAIDIGVLVLALVHLPEIGFALLSIGSLVTLAVVIPTHLKIVRSLRASRA